MVTKQPIALIAGITGQDGSYMAELLATKGYKVFGISRDPSLAPTKNIFHLASVVTLIYSSYELHQLIDIIRKTQPSEIYNFAGQSYVSKSWGMVEETVHSQGIITSRFLEAILTTDPEIRFLNASSSEVFTQNHSGLIDEESLIRPYNPYGCSKALGHCMVDAYRNTRGLFAVNAILFPHESPRRNSNFAFKKIINAAAAIKRGSNERLKLGNLQVCRDWGYAPSFVQAMHQMLLADSLENLCLCTGQSRSVEDVVANAFSYVGLDWREYVDVDVGLLRVNEPQNIIGDPGKAFRKLAWRATPCFEDLFACVIDFELRAVSGQENDFRNENPRFF
jgi:GDPmannose 4,6-dehydratase